MEPTKDKVVVFTRNNARIYTNVDYKAFENDKNAFLNPDLSSVKGVAPHFWKVNSENRIVGMDDEEKEVRLKDMYQYGIDNGEGYTDVPANQIIIRPVYVEVPTEVVVEKVVEVEKVIEKIVEVPVDRIVEKHIIHEVLKDVFVPQEKLVTVEVIKEVFIPQEKLIVKEVIKEVVVVQEKIVEVIVPKYLEKEVIHPYEIVQEVVVIQEKLITSKLAWILLGLQTIGVIVWRLML